MISLVLPVACAPCYHGAARQRVLLSRNRLVVWWHFLRKTGDHPGPKSGAGFSPENAPGGGHGGQERGDQARRRQLESAPRRSDRGPPEDPAGEGRRAALRRHGDLRRDSRERARRRRVRGPVDVLSGERPPDGAADHHRCAAALLGAAHHGGGAVFRLCPAGPQAGAAHADLGQARRQPDHPCGRRPRAHARPARRPDPGLLRYPDRQSLRLAR